MTSKFILSAQLYCLREKGCPKPVMSSKTYMSWSQNLDIYVL